MLYRCLKPLDDERHKLTAVEYPRTCFPAFNYTIEAEFSIKAYQDSCHKAEAVLQYGFSNIIEYVMGVSMGHVICIASQKGGTGKTTTAVNIAAALALFEKKTLVVDCDPLGNATTGLGLNKDMIAFSLFHALMGKASFFSTTLRTCQAHLSLIPASNDLFSVENQKTPGIDCERVLQGLIRNTANEYDYIIIDSPPSLGYLCTSALASADYLIIPTQRRLFSFEGLGPLLSLIQNVRFRVNPRLKIAGILLTMIEKDFHPSTEKTPDFLISLKGRIFHTAIPMDTTLADASDHGKPGVLYDITAPGPEAYMSLAQEVHGMLSS